MHVSVWMENNIAIHDREWNQTVKKKKEKKKAAFEVIVYSWERCFLLMQSHVDLHFQVYFHNWGSQTVLYTFKKQSNRQHLFRILSSSYTAQGSVFLPFYSFFS